MCLDWLLFCFCCFDELSPTTNLQSMFWPCKSCKVLSLLKFKTLQNSVCKMCFNNCGLNSSFCKNPSVRKKEFFKIFMQSFKYSGVDKQHLIHMLKNKLDDNCYGRSHAYLCAGTSENFVMTPYPLL